MYCTNCGCELIEGAEFCSRCGARIYPEDFASESGAHQVRQSPETAVAQGTANGGRGVVAPAVIGVAVGLLAVIAIVAALFATGAIGGARDALPDGDADNASSMSSSEKDPAERSADAASSEAIEGGEGSDDGVVVDGAGELSSAAAESALPSQDASDLETNALLETECVRVSLPRDLVESGYQWSEESDECVDLTDANGSVLASVIWGVAATRENEAKLESYAIGTVSHGSIGYPAYLKLYYLDSAGKRIHWGVDDTGELATDRMGVELQDIVSWIELYSPGGFRSAVLQDPKGTQGTQGGNSSGTGTSLTEPFYGVWVAASKDYDEARSMANELEAVGLHGTVFLTTDWSNLNPEPWYVVAAGYARAEPEAQSLCERVHALGYTDAYVKYSGDYIG